MVLLKVLFLLVFSCFFAVLTQSQYIKRPEVKHYEGEWIALGQGYDSITLNMTARMRVPLISETCDTCVMTDVLLMDIKCYQSGELVYRVENLENKYGKQYFIATMTSPEHSNKVKFNFRYADDKNTSEDGKGEGTLMFPDGIMKMEIYPKEFPENDTLLDDQHSDEKLRSPYSIPTKLYFVKKTKAILL